MLNAICNFPLILKSKITLFYFKIHNFEKENHTFGIKNSHFWSRQLTHLQLEFALLGFKLLKTHSQIKSLSFENQY